MSRDERVITPNKANDKMVTVTVARGKSIQQRIAPAGGKVSKHDPIKQFMPGETCQVPAWDVERLLKSGFIVDPDEKPLPKDAEDVDMSGYFKTADGDGPSIKQGSAA